MNFAIRLAVAAAATGLAGGAQAQTLGIGTNPQGSLGYSIAAALAKTMSESAKVPTRAVGMGGSSVFIPQVNSGELAFCTSNVFESAFAATGTGYFKGQPNENVRVAAALVPFTVGIMVPKASAIKTHQDLKGKPFPARYASMKLVAAIQDAIFKAVDMEKDGIRPVPVPNFVKGADLMAEGKVAGVLLAPGSGVTRKTNARVPVRFLSIPDTPEVRASLVKSLPGSRLATVKPNKRATGIFEPTNLVGYQYTLLTHKGLSEETVYKVVKAIAENKAALAKSHGVFNRFNPANMAAAIEGISYHPGAMRYYKERGWLKGSK